MADALVAAEYVTECSQMFLVARRNALDATLQGLGYEKSNIDDVVKMTWEALEAVIVTWTKAFRHAINVGLSTEHELCTRVFAGRHAAVGHGIFVDLSRCVMLHMLSFTEAVAMTKRATEKLFKVLDMYEAVRDASPVIEAFLSADEPAAAEHHSHHSGLAELSPRSPPCGPGSASPPPPSSASWRARSAPTPASSRCPAAWCTR